MIQLTRLNKHPLIVNSDLIKFVEKAPDTVLTLISDEKIVVLESSEEVLAKVVEFRRDILCTSGSNAHSHAPGNPASASRLRTPPTRLTDG